MTRHVSMLIAMFILLTPTVLLADSGQKETKNPTFRGLEWGSEKAEVIEKEGKPDTQSNAGLAYKDSISATDCMVLFYFDDGLSMGLYVFTPSYFNDIKHLRDYNDINQLLKSKYGAPDKTVRNRDNNEYTDAGQELSIGKLAWLDAWRIGDVRISHIVGRDEDGIYHTLEYKNLPLTKERDEQREEETKEKL